MKVKLNPDKMAAFIGENSHAHMGSSCHSRQNLGRRGDDEGSHDDSSD